MSFILKQSTASQDIVIGAFVDDTDFKTAETGLTIANTDIKLMKDGAASVDKNSGGGTHRINGFYSITLDATDTGTVGQLMISVKVAGALPVWLECQVIEETVYDLVYLPAATGDVKLQGITHTSAVIPTVTTLTGHTAQTADHTAGIADIPTVSEFNARTIASADYFDPAADTVVNVTNVATLTGHTAQTADHTAGIADIPTVAEFNARTILSADYFDPTTDAVANVTLVATTTTNTDVTALNDVAATDIVSAGAITTLAGAVVNVDLCDTTTTNTDMRGTDGVPGALVSGTADSGSTTTMVDAARTEGDTDFFKGGLIVFTSGNILGQARLITGFNFTTNTVTFAPALTQAVVVQDYEIHAHGDVDLVNTVTTLTGHTAQTADHTAGIADIPTVSEFEARTIVAANYFDPAADTVANVTLVATTTTNTDVTALNDIAATDIVSSGAITTLAGAVVNVDLCDLTTTTTTATNLTTNNDKAGYALSVAGVDLIWDETMAGHVTADTAGLVMNDWQNGGRLDVILDARMAEASIDTTAGAIDLVTLTATTTTNTDMRGTDSALLAASINLTGGAVDLVTTTTTATNLTTNNDKTGYALSTAGDQSIADLILPPTNIAFPDIEFLFVAASDHVTPVTGATGTAVTRSIDGSAFGAGTGTLAEVANGIYQYDASAADMNGKIITFRFVGTGGTPGAPDDTFVTVVTSK
jgi:hypothetical protein